MDGENGGKRYTLSGEGVPSLLTAAAKFFIVAAEVLDEAKYLMKAKAQLAVEELKVAQHPEVARGRVEVAILASRTAKAQIDRERHLRDQKRQQPRPPQSPPQQAAPDALKQGTEPQKQRAPKPHEKPLTQKLQIPAEVAAAVVAKPTEETQAPAPTA
jgi:hypothetical protein